MRYGKFLKSVGAKLRAERKKRKLSLTVVAPAVGLHYSSLCQIELGNSDMHILVLKSLADYYDMRVTEFLEFNL